MLTPQELRQQIRMDEHGNITLTVTHEEYRKLNWAIECAIDKDEDYKFREGQYLSQTPEKWRELSSKLEDQVYIPDNDEEKQKARLLQTLKTIQTLETEFYQTLVQRFGRNVQVSNGL